MNKEEVYQVMDRAMQKRRTAETLLNAHSSRSHVVFTVTVHIKSVAQDDECEEEVFKMGKFNLVSYRRTLSTLFKLYNLRSLLRRSVEY